MTEADQTHLFITEFCNQMTKVYHGIRDIHSWYIFQDRRPGSILDRFNQDAASWAEYSKMFQV